MGLINQIQAVETLRHEDVIGYDNEVTTLDTTQNVLPVFFVVVVPDM